MANCGKTVIVAALDGTFQRQPFGSILNLVPMAESVIKLKAVCMICFNDAAFTKRLGAEQEVREWIPPHSLVMPYHITISPGGGDWWG